MATNGCGLSPEFFRCQQPKVAIVAKKNRRSRRLFGQSWNSSGIGGALMTRPVLSKSMTRLRFDAVKPLTHTHTYRVPSLGIVATLVGAPRSPVTCCFVMPASIRRASDHWNGVPAQADKAMASEKISRFIHRSPCVSLNRSNLRDFHSESNMTLVISPASRVWSGTAIRRAPKSFDCVPGFARVSPAGPQRAPWIDSSGQDHA